MIGTIVAVFTLLGAAVAVPISPSTIDGVIPSRAGFSSEGTTTAGASADTDSGVPASSLDAAGNVLRQAGPGFAAGAFLASPSIWLRCLTTRERSIAVHIPHKTVPQVCT